MAHFIGYLQGNRGAASRLGTPASGMTATAQGWNCGATVFCMVRDGMDHVEVRIHTGSGNRGGFTICTLSEEQIRNIIDGKSTGIFELRRKS